jgi:hypothetical protein
MKRALVVVLLTSIYARAQTINPATQINWPDVTGTGAPTLSCTSANYGQPYTDTTNNKQYNCSASGWIQVGLATGPQYKGAVYNGTGSGSNYALGSANWGTDSAGNNLIVPGQIRAEQLGFGLFNADEMGGIANALAAPSFGTGTVFIDPNYTTWDQSAMDIAKGTRLAFMDLRQGHLTFKSISPSPTGSGNANVLFNCINSQTLPDTFGAYATPVLNTCFQTNYISDVPGYSYGAIYPSLPTGSYRTALWSAIGDIFSASINHSLVSAQINAYGKGDTQTFDFNVTNEYGGGDESAGEGNHVLRLFSNIGGYQFIGSLMAAGVDDPTDGYVTLSVAAPGPRLGVMRILLDTTTGVVADTVNSFAAVGDGSNALTMASSSYPVSTVVTLASNISPPASSEQAKTSETFTVTTASDLTPLVGRQFQFNTGNSMECATIKSVGAFSAGSQTITALLGEFHGTGAKMYIGGMACHYLVTDSSVMARTANSHITYYILGSTANNTLIEARLAQASLDAAIVGIPGAVHIYTGARVLDVRCTAACPVGAVPGIDDQVVKVEETNATWNNSDGILSSMMATGQNDTFYYNLTDNNPMSSGSTLWFLLSGAQMGGYGGRDFMRVQNAMNDSDYTWGGGPFNMGYVLDWQGPIGGVFNFDHPMHGAFMTNFNCGFTFSQTFQSFIGSMCPGTGHGSFGSSMAGGWTLDGDVQIIPDGGPLSQFTASFSAAQGIHLDHTVVQGTDGVGTQSLIVKSHANPSSNPDFEVDGTSSLNGNVSLGGTLTTTGSGKIQFPGAINCVIGTDGSGNLVGCFSGTLAASRFQATQFVLNNGSYNVGSVYTDTGGTISHLNADVGQVEVYGAGGILLLDNNQGIGLGGSGKIIGANPAGLTLIDAAFGNVGGTIQLQVADYSGATHQTLLSTDALSVSGQISDLHLTQNGGTTTVGGLLQLKSYTVSTLPTCASGIVDTIAVVDDATSPTWGSVPTGGGSAHVSVLCDGSAWKIN